MTNLATDLDGQGANLNKLIASAAGTVQLLATKGNDLGQLNGTLAQLTGTLDTDTSQIEQLVEQYDTVSTTVAQHSGQLNDAITQLAGASSGLVSLLVPNLQPLEADVGTVTTVGRTLDRNLSSVDEILQNGNNLFQGAERAYDPTYNWLDLNLATAPGVTGAYIAGLLRDRLAGICRRIVANHSSGLSAAVLATLNQCGNPSSGFFDPLLNDIPTILDTLNGGSELRHRAVAAAAGPDPDRQRRSRAPRPQPTTPAAPTPAQKSTGVDHDHDRPCRRRPRRPRPPVRPPRRRSSAARGARAPGRARARGSSSGLGGLLSNQVSACGEPAHRDAGRRRPSTPSANADPTLTAPAASLLPPLPQGQGRPPHARAPWPSRRAGRTTWRAGSDARRARPVVGAGVSRCCRSCGARRRPGRLLRVRRRRPAHGDRRLHATSAISPAAPRCSWPTCPSARCSSIALDGDKAKVTLAFDNGVRIPADVSAAIDRTTILGDQFVQLNVPKNETGAAAATAPQLADGARIAHTSLVPDVEQFVAGRIGGLRRHLHDGARADH